MLVRLTIATWLTTLPVQATDMNFYGSLVAEPCSLQLGDEAITLEFGTIIDKYLYLNGRTNSKPITLHLLECDTNLGMLVNMRFTGTESTVLPGFLAFDMSSQAKGAGIGFETQGGVAVPLGTNSPAFKLEEGSNVITLNAYVKGEPDALAQHSLVHGSFSAIATFNLEYE
uniref:fimbrial protein n=2 Tax=Serratia TaxID=613 RepID=UPI001F4BD384|nr:fimbrial protein [Serratia proteamaculans]